VPWPPSRLAEESAVDVALVHVEDVVDGGAWIALPLRAAASVHAEILA